MRIYLPLFLLGSVMLTGCADDLVGPPVETAGITAPVSAETAPPSLFKLWAAPDLPGDYQMSFQHTERLDQPAGADDARLAFAGDGAYRPTHTFSTPDAPADRVFFTMEGSTGVNRYVSFVLIDAEGEVMAEAKGQADETYSRLEVDISFADGTSRHVVLSPVEKAAAL